MWCVAAHEPAGRQHLLILRLNLFYSRAQRSRARQYRFPIATRLVFLYGRPETDPSIIPVSVKSAGAFEAFRNTALIVAV